MSKKIPSYAVKNNLTNRDSLCILRVYTIKEHKMKATIRELRASTKEILSAVFRGTTVLVTNRGKPCAKIVPVSDKKTHQKDEPLFGIWKNDKGIKSVKNYVRNMRKSRHAR